jgi:ABC-type phosphate transport system substrate-binding protein
MKRVRAFFASLALLAGLTSGAQDRDVPVLIGHPTLPKIDQVSVQRLYTGRSVEVAGVPVTVVNAAAGSRLRERFMADVMNQDDSRYVAYWTVRKHVGKGTPPRELKSAGEIIEFVQSTPGAMGYIAASDVRPGLNVVMKP